MSGIVCELVDQIRGPTRKYELQMEDSHTGGSSGIYVGLRRQGSGAEMKFCEDIDFQRGAAVGTIEYGTWICEVIARCRNLRDLGRNMSVSPKL